MLDISEWKFQTNSINFNHFIPISYNTCASRFVTECSIYQTKWKFETNSIKSITNFILYMCHWVCFKINICVYIKMIVKIYSKVFSCYWCPFKCSPVEASAEIKFDIFMWLLSSTTSQHRTAFIQKTSLPDA